MAKTRTAQQNYDFWIANAERYEGWAAKPENKAGRERHLARAEAAREKAQQYLSPASSGAQTVA